MRNTAPQIWIDPQRSRAVRRKPVWVVWGVVVLGVAVSPIPLPSAQPTEKVVRLEVSDEGFSPAVITASPGDKLTLEIVATDVVHGLYVDGYGLDVTVDPGQTASLTFVADQAGTFRFRCSVACGTLHPFLIGKLRVGTNSILWRSIVLSVLIAWAVIWSTRR